MSEYKETVTTSQAAGLTPDGAPVQQQTRQVSTQAAADDTTTATNVIRYIIGLILVLLAFRFVMKLFGANPSSGFVNFIYNVTNVLTAPFDNIFGVTRVSTGEVHSVFEPSILVAVVVYALLGWAIIKLLTLNRAR